MVGEEEVRGVLVVTREDRDILVLLLAQFGIKGVEEVFGKVDDQVIDLLVEGEQGVVLFDGQDRQHILHI